MHTFACETITSTIFFSSQLIIKALHLNTFYGRKTHAGFKNTKHFSKNSSHENDK